MRGTLMKKFTVMVLVLALGMAPATWATMVLPQTAESLTQKAELIFVATCLSQAVKAGPPVHTEYTFKIEEAVKGGLAPGATFTLRQWGGVPGQHPAGVKSAPRLIGMPGYVPWERYMLFLGTESQAGFRAPIALGQGVFRVTKAADGTVTVQNEMGNRFLYPSAAPDDATTGKSVRPTSRSTGPLRLNEFIHDIRKSGGQP